LAEQLLTSLDEPSEVEMEKLWIEEAKRRLAEYRAGQGKAIPAEEVFRRALADLQWQPQLQTNLAHWAGV
jgi:putative addiction module component (TIGR02574 family)